MRWIIAIALGTLLGCGKGENAGVEEARKQAEAEQQKAAHTESAKKILPPVPGRTKLPCTQVLDADKMMQVLGETKPVTIAEGKDAEAAASCSIIRGGKKLTEAEQKAAIKQNGRLGVLPGDEICNISAYCWTIEDGDRFKKKCTEKGADPLGPGVDDDTLGFYACKRVIATGEDDVNNYRFFDDDTKCVIGVRAGPSNVNNDLIGKCARAAHDLIGPEQIAVKK